MFKHVNVERKKEKLIKFFSETLNIFNQNNFFEIINYIGCYLPALFKTHYSASDCCNTVEILEKLFEIKNNEIKNVDHIQLNKILSYEGNYFFNFKVMGKGIPFHTFVVVKYKNEWFLLQSFVGICGLKVFKDSDIPNILEDLLRYPNSEEFNSLFGTNIKGDIQINTLLSYEKFSEVPLEKLYDLIIKFLQNK